MLHIFFRNLWLWKCGLQEDSPRSALFDIKSLKESEWSPEFERLMRNRLVLGALRYGKLHAPGKPGYDRLGSAIRRLERYRDTGNKEFLVDVANLCLLEFEECQHPFQHFSAIDDGEHVVRVRNDF